MTRSCLVWVVLAPACLRLDAQTSENVSASTTTRSATPVPALLGPDRPGVDEPLGARPSRVLYPSQVGAAFAGRLETQTTNGAEPDVPLMPEGYRIVQRPGSVQMIGRWWVFVADSSPSEIVIPPLRLLPNRTLSVMEAAVRRPDTVPRFRVTGVITEYRGVNYLLMSDAQLDLAAREGPAVGAGAEPSSAATIAESATELPSADEILHQLARERVVAAQPLPSVDAVVSSEPGDAEERSRGAGVPDGTLLVDRVARLVRDRDWWLLAFEASEGSTGPPAMTLLPSRLLETMERMSAGGTEHVAFIISGEVWTYRSTNSVLLRKVLVKRNLGNLP